MSTVTLGGRGLPLTDTIIARFIAKIQRTADCWLWTGSVTRMGYGQFAIRHGKNIAAHRFAWHLWRSPVEGESQSGPYLDRKNVLHRCDVRRCVNPDHLWIGSHSDNVIDALRKGRYQNRQDAVNE